MTRAEVAKCLQQLQQIRAAIRDNRSAAQISADEHVSAAYSLTIDLEKALEDLVPPWED